MVIAVSQDADASFATALATPRELFGQCCLLRSFSKSPQGHARIFSAAASPIGPSRYSDWVYWAGIGISVQAGGSGNDDEPKEVSLPIDRSQTGEDRRAQTRGRDRHFLQQSPPIGRQ